MRQDENHLRVSRPSPPQLRVGPHERGRHEAICPEAGRGRAPVKLDSQAKSALLVGGKAEILLRLVSPRQPDYREKIWDQAAGSVILEESGCRIASLDTRPLGFSAGSTLARNRSVLTTNGRWHDAALQALRRSDGKP